MADDALRQFYNRAARTLSIAVEVFQQLKTGGDIEASLLRLELELDGWLPDIDARNSYYTALQDFAIANANWRHSGIGPKPECPEWPKSLPQFDEARELLDQFSGNK